MTREKQNALNACVKAAERCAELAPAALEELVEHVQRAGTDSEGGLPVDHLTRAFLDAAVWEKR